MSKFAIFTVVFFCILAAFGVAALYVFLGFLHIMWFLTKWAAIVGWLIIVFGVLYLVIRHELRVLFKK